MSRRSVRTAVAIVIAVAATVAAVPGAGAYVFQKADRDDTKGPLDLSSVELRRNAAAGENRFILTTP